MGSHHAGPVRRAPTHARNSCGSTPRPRAAHLTAQQPDTNIVRVALQALAATLGGTQSLHCNGRDEALALPTEESARIALRTQQIIAAETGVPETADPVGGAWAIEQLTNQVEQEATALLDRIHEQGGGLAAVETGFIQQEIQRSAYQAQQAIDSGASTVVGVNQYVAEDPPIEAQQIDPRLEAAQIARVQAVRASRDPVRWRTALRRVEQAARGETNLIPPIIEAVESHATVGEIADTLRNVFGEYQERA